MRASELIDSPAYDESGRFVGVVRDLRVDAEPSADGSFPILGIVLSAPGARAAADFAWGFAEGRALGPGWLKRLLDLGGKHSRFVPAAAVRDWGPERVVVADE